MTFSDIFAAFRWWTVVMVVGVLATPLTFFVLRRLPDRGYAFVKLIGLLVVGYVFWLLGSLGFLDNNLGGILVALIVLGGLSFWSYRRLDSEEPERQPVISWIKANWRYILIAELVFALVFAVWTWVRAQNPAIMGTEKPMEFAFLNSLGRSPDFPPLDPWMSGFAISYYYFGYVIASVITRLAAVPEAVGFNLSIAWLTAASALSAFGLVFNLISSSRQAIRRSAIIFALIAAVALPIAGNLEIAAEVLYANGIGSPETWEWLDIRDLNEPLNTSSEPRYETSQWWWWRSSRVIHEYSLSGREEAGLEPIAEFPGFSFVLGDLHSHVISLPFAFLSLAAALSWWLNPGSDGIDVKQLFKLRSIRSLKEYMRSNNGTLLLFTLLLLGGLSFLNTWDVLIHMFIIVAAFMLALWRRVGHWHKGILRQGISLAILLVIGSLILYLPFYMGFRSQAGPPFLLPMIMRPTRLVHFLVIFGMSMIGVVALLLTLFVRGVRTPSRAGRHRYWARSLGIALLILVVLGGTDITESFHRPYSLLTPGYRFAVGDFRRCLFANPSSRQKL
jgi:YYY domain-containing protein